MMGFLLYGMQNFFANPVVLAALATAASIAALAYMMGEFFNMPSIKAFSKLELRELGVTAVIIILCVLLTMPNGPFDKVGQGMAPAPSPAGSPPKTCPEWLNTHGPLMGNQLQGWYYEKGNYAIGQSDYFLGCRWDLMDIITGGYAYTSSGKNGVMMPALVGAYQMMLLYEMLTGLLGSFNFDLNIPIPYVPFVTIIISNLGLFSFMMPINESHTLLVDLVGTMMSGFAAQKMLLNFIDLTMFDFFLPFGLMLRAFPFSRKTGSTIIAVVFAAYFVFPLTILLNWQMWNMVQDPPSCNEPGIGHVGDTCSKDSECCTNSCSMGKCQPVISDFRDMESTMQLCGKNILDPTLSSDLETKLSTEGQKEEAYFIQLEQGKLQQTEPGSKTQVRLERQQEEKERQEALRQNRLAEGATSVFASPKKIMSLGFGLFEWFVSKESKLLALSILFLVNSIVITLTLLKDFSLLIGGEPRLLGITKLV